MKASLPKSFEWSLSGPLIGPKDDSYDLAGIKDPSIIEVDGVYHVFASTAKESGYNLVYLGFTDFDEANSATFHYRDQIPFEPHKLWYLVYQNGNAAYSTNSDISNPCWNLGNGTWVDMWTICDSSDCYLFSSDDYGHLYRSQTSLGNFPKGMGNTASNVYSTGDGEYLFLVEAIGSDGARYFRSWTSISLSGTWTSLADTEAHPFARSNNVKFSTEAWSKSISHGEMVRTKVDQTMAITSCNLRYLYQGVETWAPHPGHLCVLTGNYRTG
ncbi:glycosyl hydrolase family 62-domain-containing protein [Aspergillus caelatus]|uniref:Alpha-L-arabinofuranosidase n=1 Tax=Aspergillus caelatus TaxID=61420 RepID=A0A5N7AE59_9EURO|nr:glycosyl hydrolase family 62-domain-containing protein [Aspergillus caelatus]KAE8367995.1 glycosyl hydrolase family 62-domain-containing protein [Aspergillus caelatus]